MKIIQDQIVRVYDWSEIDGFWPYQAVVLWYPVAGTIIADMMVAMLKVGH